jgi:hypothetical protein
MGLVNVNTESFKESSLNLLWSFLVMIPWPLIGIVASWGLSLFESVGESIFMFGGVTMILLLPLALFVNSVWVFGAIAVLVWLFVVYLPIVFGHRLTRIGISLPIIFVGQSLFSAMQAGLGFLIVLGKQV